MSRKENIILCVVVGLGLILLVSFAGWLPLFTLFGCRVVEPEYTISNYETEITPIFEQWKAVINDWEESPTQLNADACYHQMQGIISSWNSISPPEEYKDYHLWMGNAMEYEAEAFRIIADCSPDKLADVRDLTVRLWVLKDEALLKAEASIPKK